MDTIPVEIIACILDLIEEYHIVLILVCKLWQRIMLNKQNSGNAYCLYVQALRTNNISLAKWLLGRCRYWNLDTMETTIRSYQHGNIGRSDMYALMHTPENIAYSRFTFSRDVIYTIIQNRDEQLFRDIITNYKDTVCTDHLMQLQVKHVQWAMDMGFPVTDDLYSDGFISLGSDNTTIWMISKGFRVKPEIFLELLVMIPYKVVKQLLQCGMRISNPMQMDSEVWGYKKLLRKLLEYHDWKAYKHQILTLDLNEKCRRLIEAM